MTVRCTSSINLRDSSRRVECDTHVAGEAGRLVVGEVLAPLAT
jgi:hypothetical protein